MVSAQLLVEIIGIAGSLLLSTFLVLLYKKQTELNEYEMNRDARKIHTAVLKERIQYWLGETDEPQEYPPHHPLSDNSTNLPSVGRTSVSPASDETTIWGVGEERPFRVIPGKLDGDRYMEDFLENHAEDIESLRQEILTLNSKFTSQREEFYNKCPEGRESEKSEYRIRPIEGNFEEWLFERVILLERGFYNKEDLKEMVESGVTGPGPGAREDSIRFQGVPGDSGPAVYECEFKSIEGLSEYSQKNFSAEVESAVIECLSAAIEEIIDHDSYKLGTEAANTLDELQLKVSELEESLIVYEGRPIYAGNCKFLEEAKVDSPDLRERIKNRISIADH
jgi:hypothetical protein